MSDDKTERPTEHKLRQAREHGQVPKSQDAASVVAMAAVACVLVGMQAWGMEQFRAIGRIALDAIGRIEDTQSLLVAAQQLFSTGIGLILPLTIAGIAGGVAGMLMQVGVNISFQPVSPKFDSLNPANGIKRIFSIRSLLELLLMSARAVIVAIVVWWLIRSSLPMAAGAAYHTPQLIAETWWHVVLRLLVAGILVLIMLAPLDYALQRWQYLKDQRMSKDEVKREYREMEGDPHIKSERRALAREMANAPPPGRNASGRARVLITNPTHYAVALAWHPGTLPSILARGMDDDAAHMREEAQRDGVAVITNPPLARKLYRLGVGQPITEDLFGPVIAILKLVICVESLAPPAPLASSTEMR